ncbi:hypothetical protein JUM41_15270 [Rhizobium pusense]|uniref:hypothetical protein n=1 Tax=Agrobacterium pusense TaxID=648995 RepID=UPI001FCCD8DC|nr:hypothetical protein [Agrobacterium pusense]MCJ2875605.1 hypothetical protein [Agrobacterium pusense]
MNYVTFELLQFPYVLDNQDRQPSASDVSDVRVAYDEFSERLSRVLETSDGTRFLANFVRRLLDSIKTHLDNCLLPGETRKPAIPMLAQQKLREYMTRIDALSSGSTNVEKANLNLQVLAAYLYETRNIWIVGPVIEIPQLPPNLIAELVNYTTWRLGQESRDSDADIFGIKSFEQKRLGYLDNQVEKLLSGQRNSVASLGAIIDETKIRLDDTLQRLDVDSNTTKAKVTEMSQSLDASKHELAMLLAEIEATKANVKAFKEAVRIEFGTDATKKLWKYRANWSAASFWISAVVIAIAIIAPPWYALTHISLVVEVLKAIGDAAAHGFSENGTPAQITASAISRLVIVSAPLALYFWAIKLLVRFNTRSMVLMDDARQRHTTMDTYSHLVEKNKATVEERGLMLSALFRPLPGQGAENVEPPNFIEIINKKPD